MTVYNLRGTHGSGKSTLIQKLLKQYDGVAIIVDGKTRGYKISAPEFRKPVFIVGPYATACGGCDAIQPYASIWPLVETFALRGHVVFEGALVSSCVGSLGEELIERRRVVVVGYLDTPLEVCLSRIAARRAKKGDLRPLNPKNTTAKFESVARTRTKFEEAGVRCLTLEHKQAYKQLLEVLLENRKG